MRGRSLDAMSLTPEQQKELDAFPPPLKALLLAELAAGNSIEEVGHTHPAPPAGAYIKLSRKVGTRPRASGDGLDFYERQTPQYSGEFTDDRRFYFLLEPPDPPPPEPDMDAIRAALNPAPDRLARLAAREPRSDASFQARPDASRRRSEAAARTRRALAEIPDPKKSRAGHPASESPTGAVWAITFRDERPPIEIQYLLERYLMTLLSPRMESGKLVGRCDCRIHGIRYGVLLRYLIAVGSKNYYQLFVDASWPDAAPDQREYSRRSAGSWIDFWTRTFVDGIPPVARQGSAKRYADLCEETLATEARLHSVEAIQQAIVTAMKEGACFLTSHKEGGTRIEWRHGSFHRSDYGESTESQSFSSEAEFLKFLRRFYDWETSANVYPDKVPDLVAWQLILRLMHPG